MLTWMLRLPDALPALSNAPRIESLGFKPVGLWKSTANVLSGWIVIEEETATGANSCMPGGWQGAPIRPTERLMIVMPSEETSNVTMSPGAA